MQTLAIIIICATCIGSFLLSFWALDKLDARRFRKLIEETGEAHYRDYVREREGPRMTQAQMDAINADRNYWL